MVKPGKKQKNPPFLSHEFIIQNHADIISCIAMIFVVGLMVQATSAVASMFVTMHHNITVTDNATEDSETVEGETVDHIFYTYGLKDVFAIFFYSLICIVVHAVIQEYVLDKLNKRMHLSKIKHSKFNESGQLLVFYALSAVWGADVIFGQDFVPTISNLWDGYPHIMAFVVKFYFIIQISYWVHNFPELYFQKVKKEEMMSRISYSTLYLVFIGVGYLLNFHRVMFVILVLHYAVEALFHAGRLFHFSERPELAKSLFMLWNVAFIVVRLGTIILAIVTFWTGFSKAGQPVVDVAARNFNTSLVRLNSLIAVVLLQMWLMWNFIGFQVKRLREKTAQKQRKQVEKKKDKKKKGAASQSDDTDSEVNENGAARSRGTPKAKKA